MLLAHYSELMNDKSLSFDFEQIYRALTDILVYMSEICSIIGYDFCTEFERYTKDEFSTVGETNRIIFKIKILELARIFLWNSSTT